jgi:hypothetical protein
VEIVFRGDPVAGKTYSNAEVNYAAGGKSSAYEKVAGTTSVKITKAESKGVVEGTVSASYDNPTADIKGTFHAEFCDGGQGY